MLMTRPEYKGTVDTTDPVKYAIKGLAADWPLGAEVEHIRTGLRGVILLDEPPNVPGLFTGDPTAWCLIGSGAAVFASWQNSDGIPFVVWQRTEYLTLTRQRSPLAVVTPKKPKRRERRRAGGR